MDIRDGDCLTLIIETEEADETAEDVKRALHGVAVPLAGGRATDPTFDGQSLVLDFLIATASGLSVEGLRALVWAALRHRSEDRSDVREATPRISVTVTADGVVEIRILPED